MRKLAKSVRLSLYCSSRLGLNYSKRLPVPSVDMQCRLHSKLILPMSSSAMWWVFRWLLADNSNSNMHLFAILLMKSRQRPPQFKERLYPLCRWHWSYQKSIYAFTYSRLCNWKVVCKCCSWISNTLSSKSPIVYQRLTICWDLKSRWFVSFVYPCL